MDSPAAAPAPAPAPDPASTPAADPPAPATPTGDTPAPGTPATPPAPAEGTPPAAAAPADVKPKLNVTARLAALSSENRRAQAAIRQAEARAEAAAAKASEFESAVEAAKNSPAAVKALLEKIGVPFERVVDAYAEQELTPDQKVAAQLAAVQKRLDDDAAAREREAQAAQQRALENDRAEKIGGIVESIKAGADKFEICARLGEEAANDVFAEVVTAWNKAGRPQLMPGEYEEAVQAAIELTELRYEERGKKLAKTKAANGAVNGNGAHAPAANGSDLPAGLTADKPISDKDEDILKGLIDKTAPAFGSARAKPRSINSELGGSAPPPAPARGSMDPRDALRDVLAGAGLVP